MNEYRLDRTGRRQSATSLAADLAIFLTPVFGPGRLDDSEAHVAPALQDWAQNAAYYVPKAGRLS